MGYLKTNKPNTINREGYAANKEGSAAGFGAVKASSSALAAPIRAAALALLLSSALFTLACIVEKPLVPGGNVVSVDTPAPSAADGGANTPEPTPEPTPALYSLVRIENSKLSDGMQVLVNYNHSYAHTSAVEQLVRPVEKSRELLLAKADAALLDEVLTALQAFAEGFYEATGGDRLLVTSAFRTEQYQRELYDDYVKQHGEEMARIYVADPGSSEHHTGYAVDLSTMSKDGLRIPLIEHQHFDWVNAHCADHGFILRYPVGSEEITRVAYEPWHFRYLGRTHAAACTALEMVYEEYVEHLKVYTIESGMLRVELTEGGAEVSVAEINALPSSGTLIYFVPASEGDETMLPIPAGCNEYSVSGNNEDGFIVTVSLGGE